MNDNAKYCARCILDGSIPGIRFDEQSVCNYCRLHDSLERQYPLGEEGERRINKLIVKIQSESGSSPYDCLVGLSGGCDSTYALHEAVRRGLKVLAVNFDDGWGSAIAAENIKKVVDKLGIGYRQVHAEGETMNDWYRACLKASIPEPDLPCDIGYLSALWNVAAEEDVRYIIVGNTFRAEGLLPLRWHYVDGKYFNEIIKRFARNRSARGFNRCGLVSSAYYLFIKRIKMVQLLVHIGYDRSTASKLLQQEYGWQEPGAKHFDNLFQSLVSYVTRNKFRHDWRKIRLSAQVRSGELSRGEAFAEIGREPGIEDPKHLKFCLEKLALSEKDLDRLMAEMPKYFSDYPTYSWIIKTLKPIIRLLCRFHLLHDTFFEKHFESG